MAAVVPARDEAEVIGPALGSLRGQDYPGRLEIVVVDDHSEDGTASEARRWSRGAGAPVHVHRAGPLPEGWAGKVWAMAQGVEWARALDPRPRYLWFTDADVQHDPDVLRRLMGRARAERTDLASTLVLLHCQGFWERLLIPPFVFFFMKLYPFRRVSRPESRVAAAAGGSMLVRKASLEAVGGLETIRDRLIDDCALARRIQEAGGTTGRAGGPSVEEAPGDAARPGRGGGAGASRGRLWLGLTRLSRSLRSYGLGGVWRMVSRSAYTQLRRSPLLLVATVVGMLLLYLVPPALALYGAGVGEWGLVGIGGGAWAFMSTAYAPTLRLYELHPWWALTLPAAALLYTVMTLHSAWLHARGRGGAWKGRTRA